MSVVLAFALFAAIFGGIDIKQSTPLRLLVALAQTFLHLLAIALVMWAAVNFAPDIWDSTAAIWLLGLRAAFLVGARTERRCSRSFSGSCTRSRGARAQEAANQVFTGQSIADYKNLLRMHLGRDGA